MEIGPCDNQDRAICNTDDEQPVFAVNVHAFFSTLPVCLALCHLNHAATLSRAFIAHGKHWPGQSRLDILIMFLQPLFKQDFILFSPGTVIKIAGHTDPA